LSYLVLARKYRPQTFDSVIGQEHVVKVLKNSILRNRVAHAYLFTGPRGVGKTSLARIFAKALNCVKGPTDSPCLACTNCEEIGQGISLAVREIDGASHNSVDNARELIESTRTSSPPGSLYKVYIIDEVHMLSTSAFNALLKVVEEPPPHTCFLFATTDPQKIPDTILSRVQRHDLRSVQTKRIEESLREMVREEGLCVSDGALSLLARNADGSLRDAHSLLERTLSFSNGEVSVEQVSHLVGTVDFSLLLKLLEAIIDRIPDEALRVVDEVFSRSVENALFLREFIEVWRVLLGVKVGGEKMVAILGGAESFASEYLRLSSLLSAKELEALSSHVLEESDRAIRSFHPRFAIEAMVVRLASREPVVVIQELLSKLSGSDTKNVTRSFNSGSTATSREVASSENLLPSPSMKVNSLSSSSCKVDSSTLDTLSMNHEIVSSEESRKPFDWYDFINSSSSIFPPFLLDSLKRLSPELLPRNILRLQGPRFVVTFVDTPEQRAKINEALKHFYPHNEFRMEFVEGDEGGRLSSIIEIERKKKVEKDENRNKLLDDNPTVQALKKVLPGSRIERKLLD
jgi:DNA polymerase III subunit gamma/tau